IDGRAASSALNATCRYERSDGLPSIVAIHTPPTTQNFLHERYTFFVSLSYTSTAPSPPHKNHDIRSRSRTTNVRWLTPWTVIVNPNVRFSGGAEHREVAAAARWS